MTHCRQQDHTYGFKVGDYNRTRTLILDQKMFDCCGYIGGSGSDTGTAIAVHGAGSTYLEEYTTSTEASLPVTIGLDLTHNGVWDAIVAKINAAGIGLAYWRLYWRLGAGCWQWHRRKRRRQCLWYNTQR